jgi:copper resistance protein B
MNRFALLSLLPLVLAVPAAAASMDQTMPGMVMPHPHPKAAVTHAAKPAHGKRPVKARTVLRAHHRPKRQMAGMSSVAPAPAAPAAVPPASQDMPGMPGMRIPSVAPSGGDVMPGATVSPSGAPDAAVAGMAGMKGMDMPAAGQGQSSVPTPAASEPDIPNAPPPPPPTDHAADRFYDPAAMAAARAALRQEHGGAFHSMVMANLAEYQTGPGGGGYRWDGEAWFGGDINRFVVKSEGDGSGRSGLGAAEVQGLYAHAIDPYFDVQAGARQDFGPGRRTYLTAGIEGLLPYWFDVQAAVFLSTRGELLGRLEGTYDLRLTQRLILQPRAELNFAAQDTSETRTGSGLSNAELGLRLRYEIRREFAPYIGVSYDAKFGKTADYARALGEVPAAPRFVVGIRAWF